MKACIPIVLVCAAAARLSTADAQATTDLGELFAPQHVAKVWTQTHCDLEPAGSGSIRVTFWKGYESTGVETSQLPVRDWSSSRSLQFDIDNQGREPLSVYVRVSDQVEHPAQRTYPGGTFDGFVVGPGRSTVQISIEAMQSPEGSALDSKRIAWLGIFVQPLFLRDGMELKFAQDTTLTISNLRLSAEPAKLQKQPYGDLLFKETEPGLQSERAQVEQDIKKLENAIAEAKRHGIETAYAEIYPFLATIAFHSRLIAFWQDRAEEQRRALDFLKEALQQQQSALEAALAGKLPIPSVPPMPDYGRLAAKDGYFRLGDQPVIPFGMLYNHGGPLLRWFANSETDYGTQLVAGGTRQNVERQPIWEAYQKFPDTHRVGWPHADHIIRDADSWEVLGPPVSVCLESPHSREAVAAMIANYERNEKGGRDHLVQNMGFEYTYVCYCDYTRRMWGDWLQRKYSGIGSANQIWGTHFEDFNAVPMPRLQEAAANRALWFDWSSFNLYRFLEQIRWTRDQIRRWQPDAPLTVGSPFYAFSPAFWTGVDEEELADSGIANVVLEENYELDTLMPEYLHALANAKPVADFEYHGVINQILPSFLHGDAAISMWWWNDQKHWTPNEPINEWTTSFPQSYTIPLSDIAKAMRDALNVRRLSREIAALGAAPRPVALLYSKSSILQQLPEEAHETDSTPYLSELRRIYKASQSAGLYIGVTTEKKIIAGDLQNRKVLVLPSVPYLPESVTNEILHWVDKGGTLVISPDSLIGDEYARPSKANRLPGFRITGTDAPHLRRGEKLVTEYNFEDLPRMQLLDRRGNPFTVGGVALSAAGVRQRIECDPAAVLAHFADGSPAAVRIARGHGTIYWLAAPLLPESWSGFLSSVAEQSGVKPDLTVTREEGGPAPEIEYRVTGFDGGRVAYFVNNSERDIRIRLRPGFSFGRIVDRSTETVLAKPSLVVPAKEAAILQFR